jgi:predicted nicotinamide N-methyase
MAGQGKTMMLNIAAAVLITLQGSSNALFVECFSRPSISFQRNDDLSLFAKTKQKKKKTGGRGRRSKQLPLDETVQVAEHQNVDQHKETSQRRKSSKTTRRALRQPTKTKTCWVRLDRPSSPLDVCLVEINDASWWQQENNVNPFGARLWPPSLALAKFLANYLDEDEHKNAVTSVVEVGCGTGLISIVAAGCGATAIATDVSDVALSLVEKGWSETSQRLKKAELPIGNLTVCSFDVFSKDPLPFPQHQHQQEKQNQSSSPSCILVASAVLYDKTLAKAMAQRVMEACNMGAWVILADDDTGLREGGRAIFEAAWQKLLDENTGCNPIQSQWTHETVQQKDVFGWSNKKVQLLHLNHPPLPGITVGANDRK